MLIEKRNKMVEVAKFWHIYWEYAEFHMGLLFIFSQDEKKSRNHCVRIFVVRTQTVLMGRIVSEEKEPTEQFSKH